MANEKKCKICKKKAVDYIEYCPEGWEKNWKRKRAYLCKNHYKTLCILMLATGDFPDEDVLEQIKEMNI